MYKRALVTGGAGFIGSHLVDELVKNGKEVFIIDNLSTGKLINISHHLGSSHVQFDGYSVDSRYIKDVFRLFKPEIVFHLAAIPGVSYSVKNPIETNQINVGGTLNVLKMSSEFNVKKFIFSSSSSVYGGTDMNPVNENIVLNPQSPYALQKKIGEEYCSLFSNSYGLDTISLRYFNVFGPRQYADSEYSAVIPAILSAIKNDKEVAIYGDGEQFRDFCYVSNVVSANLLAAISSPSFGERFNVACMEKTTINQLFDLLHGTKKRYVEPRPGDVRYSYADISRANKHIGYKPLVMFEEGLRITEEWYKSLETN